MAQIVFDRMRKVFLRYDFIFNFLPHYRRQKAALSILHEQTTSVIRDRRRNLDETNTTLENYDQDLGNYNNTN